MKRKAILIVTLVLLTSMLFSVSTASAATRRIGLISATSWESQDGAEFSFRVWGEFEGFTGFVRFQGKDYILHCSLDKADSRFLYCRMYGPSMAGKTVQVVVNGFSHTTYVSSAEPYCAPVYDWATDSGGWLYGPWANYGDHCTKYVPTEGDSTSLSGYYPDDKIYPYVYLNDGGFCGPEGSWNNYGKGFYYVQCQYNFN